MLASLARFCLAVFAALSLSACVTTQPASVASRSMPVAGLAPARIIVVAAPNLPLEERAAAETAMVSALAAHSVRAIRSSEIFPPGRAYTPEQVRQGLIDARADALLVFRGRPAERNITVAGGRYIPADTYKIEQPFGPGVVQITRFQPGTGGLSYTYDSELFHAGAPQPIWQAQAVVQGGSGISFSDLAAVAARDSMARMVADKAI